MKLEEKQALMRQRQACHRYRIHHRERVNAQTRRYRATHPERVVLWENNARAGRIQERFELKIETLSHYGMDGKLQCCWDGCRVRDVDVLSLDHVNNDGTTHRKETKTLGGSSFYRRLRKQGYPFGFQTLCMNHQFKKELMRKRNSTCQ